MPATHQGRAFLADAPPPSPGDPRTGATPGFTAGRTLPLRAELRRQLGRRRTQLTLGLLTLLPFILVLAFKLGGADGSPSGGANGTSVYVGFAKVGAANFTLFTVFAAAGFLLPVVVALLCGDTVASEASWSSLRYLLTAPVPRSRLLRQKLVIALALSAFAIVLLSVVTFVVGGLFFGWAPAQSPTGSTLTAGQTPVRLLLTVAYVIVTMLFVAALGFLVGVHTDAPLGAVGGTVMLVIVSTILDSITQLGGFRDFLPTHYQYAWTDAIEPSITWSNMAHGVFSALVYACVLLAFAWRGFLRKDILS